MLTLIKHVKSGLQSFMLEISLWMMLKPVEVDAVQIKTLIDNYQCYTMREVANILKISRSSVENHLHQLGYIDVWVPRKSVKKKKKKNFLTIFLHAILY